MEDGCLIDSAIPSLEAVAQRDDDTSDVVALRCMDVSLSYSGRLVLGNFSMEAKAGETLAIVGESGSGKSSLCQVLAGLVKPQSGLVEIDGKSVVGLSRKHCAESLRMMFQDVRGSIDERMSVRHNIALALSSTRMTDVEKRDRVLWACDVAGLDDSLLERRPSELSGGELQRACLARAIASRPSVLLLDEPFSSLDTQTRAATVQRLIAMQKEFDTCIVAVLHNVEVVKGFAHRFIALQKS
jgi:ABC-type dipeptide/oligopeptide/nickel transport system ATPase subunit